MKKKINMNREKLSSEEIARQRDFGSLMKQLGAVKPVYKPFYKSWGFIGGASALVVGTIATVLIFNLNSQQHTTEADEQTTQQQNVPQGDHTYSSNSDSSASFIGNNPFINPPFKNTDIKFTSYNVNTSAPKEISYPTGSKITIPKDAFVDKNGKVVKGDVEIRYREMHDAVDFFLSGIPMTYDSAGKHYTFESAGMMEMYAFQNGEVVKLKEGKTIKVEMASGEAGNKFNVYKLDTVTKNWVYKGKDEVKPIVNKVTDEEFPITYRIEWDLNTEGDTIYYNKESLPLMQKRTEIDQVKSDIKKIEDTKPVQPKKVDPSRYTFNIDVDPKEFPDLAVYKNLLFEVGAENKNWKPEMGKITWEDASIAEYKKEESYMLTLKKGKEKQKLIVYPVFEGDNYQQAKQEYEKKFSEYSQKLTDKKLEEKKKQAEYDVQVKKLKEEQKKYEEQVSVEQKKQQLQMKEQQKVMDRSMKVVRMFQVDGFGIWNCDSPQNFPKGATVTAKFIDESGNALNIPVVYQVDRNLNALFSYHEGNEIGEFKYNPKSKTIVWAITTDGKLAVAGEEQFSGGITSGSRNYKMKLVDVNINNENEIRQVLNFGSYAAN